MTDLSHQGIIKKITGNTLYVEVERRAACAACNAKDFCMPSEKRDELIQITTDTPNAFQVGETIQVILKQSSGAKAVVFAYLFPFLALASGLFITYYFTKNELLSIGIAFTVTILYFLFIKKIDKKIKKQFTFTVKSQNHYETSNE
jgi:sigma-E factor negative regulatory protein RseC